MTTAPSQQPFCAAVDWGTTRFRLWLLGRDGGALAERRSDEGLSSLAGRDGFPGVLEGHLAALGASAELPVIVCGMAGARQGWVEARYLDVPARLDDVVGSAVKVPDVARDVRILPGIAQRQAERPDVIRGEETKLLGLRAQGAAGGLVCMPGTHSKWVSLEGGRVEGFATFMTGELFDLLARHSILARSIESTEFGPRDPAFAAAVAEALARPAEIANRVFAVRPAELLGFAARGAGAARLSGVLIGTEIAGAASRFGAFGEALLVAEGKLAALYEAALAVAGKRTRIFDAGQAVRTGLGAAARALWP